MGGGSDEPAGETVRPDDGSGTDVSVLRVYVSITLYYVVSGGPLNLMAWILSNFRASLQHG